MKRFLTSLLAIVATVATVAQTLNVEMGSVTYQIPAKDAGEMIYADGNKVTIAGNTYYINAITRVYINSTSVADTSVVVTYDGDAASVVIDGRIARYLTVSVDGAHVSVAQSGDVGDDTSGEITYCLSGNSSDGEFYMSGSYKATVELRGLTLTNPAGAALNIQNGKRINISVKRDTENTLADGSQNNQKAALVCKGHGEFKGQGTLNIRSYGESAHGIWCGDYMTVRNCTINILKAVKDGVNCNQFFQMTSGTLTVSGVGSDGLQCGLDGDTSTGETADHEDEDSGNIYIEGGTLNITTTAAGAKCVKSDGQLRIADGTLTLNASGSVDTSDSTDPSYVAALKGDSVVINGGTISATVKGSAGRGIAGDRVETNGGTVTITNSAGVVSVNSDYKGAKGIKGDYIALNAGTITINMTAAGGKGIKAGDGTESTSGGSSGGGWGGRPGGGPGGGMGGGSTWTNITGSYSQGLADGTGPTLKITTASSYNSNSSNKGIKAICAAYLYGGTTELYTSANGAEGLESKTGVYVEGGNHYFKCYDDCINSAGKIFFNGGVTVCYGYGNDSVDSNAGTTGAITIGNGVIFAYTTKGAPEEGFDCDNNSYIQITGTGIGISAGANQGGGGGGWGGSSSGSTISNAKQGYAFVTSSISYTANRYYTLADNSGNNLVTYSFEGSCSSSLALFTATGMVKGSTYTVKYSTTAPTDATTAWHGLYLGSSHKGSTSVTSFTAK